MRNITAIAKNCFKETVRDRILYVIFVFAALMIAASLLAGSISLDQDIKIIKDFGLTSIFLFSVLMTIFIGTNLVYKEIDKRTIFLLLCKPIKKEEFILGKFAGLAATMLVMLALMGVIFLSLMRYKTGHWDFGLLEAIGLNYLELLVIIAITLVFSGFTAPLASGIYTILIFLIGHSSTMIGHMAKTASGPFLKATLNSVYYLFPNLEKFNIRNDIVYGISLSGHQFTWVSLYTIAYVGLMLTLAIIILKKQEF